MKTSQRLLVFTLLVVGLLIATDQVSAADDGFLERLKADPKKELAATKAKAAKGDAEAQCNLGFIYDLGQSVEKDYAEAAKWYRNAADQNFAAAQFRLARLYAGGLGVERDDAEAAKWCRKAADQDYAKAQLSLGTSYAGGFGVVKDDVEAMKWFRKAADQDNAAAQHALGFHYANGQGVEKDYAEAYAWFNLAAKTDTKAATLRDNLEKSMSPQRVGDAQKRTKELRAMIDAKITAASK